MTKSEKLVEIRSFNNPNELEIVKSYLESCGIDCFVRDEIINRMYFGNVNGGPKLDVPDSQAEEAIKLLLDAGYLQNKDFEPAPELKFIEKILNFFKKKQ